MISVFAGVGPAQLTIATVVVLIGLCTFLTWLPATRRDPIGAPTRTFITVGIAAAVLDPRGVGAVLGLSLAAMGVIVWWEGQPPPEVPRPHRQGYVVAAIAAGAVTYGTAQGWGPLDAIPDDGRLFAALFVGLVALLGTLAIADRARITFRDRLRRRFDVPHAPPRVLVRPLDRGHESSVTLERMPERGADDVQEWEDPAVGGRRRLAELLPAEWTSGPSTTGDTSHTEQAQALIDTPAPEPHQEKSAAESSGDGTMIDEPAAEPAAGPAAGSADESGDETSNERPDERATPPPPPPANATAPKPTKRAATTPTQSKKAAPEADAAESSTDRATSPQRNGTATAPKNGKAKTTRAAAAKRTTAKKKTPKRTTAADETSAGAHPTPEQPTPDERTPEQPIPEQPVSGRPGGDTAAAIGELDQPAEPSRRGSAGRF